MPPGTAAVGEGEDVQFFCASFLLSPVVAV